MIYSRPGYVPVKGDKPTVAKLQPDMVPAINRPSPGETTAMPDLAEKLANRTKGRTFTPPADVLKAAERSGPELILNPEPSATPKVLTPGK